MAAKERLATRRENILQARRRKQALIGRIRKMTVQSAHAPGLEQILQTRRRKQALIGRIRKT